MSLVETNPFNTILFNDLQSHTEEVLQQTPGPHYAAFDADGTLWNEDIGEQFFQYQIDNCQLSTLKDKDPWDYYLTTKAADPTRAYLWLAQINVGQPLARVRTWAKQASDRKKIQIFESQKKWISWLRKKNVGIFIVTASVQWAVEPMAHKMGVDLDHVLGIRTRVDHKGLVTDRQEGPITWREGKVQALLNRTRGIPPVFACSNTYGDVPLLEISLGDKLCIQTQTEKKPLNTEEEKLRFYAEKRKWKTHHFFKI